MPLLVFRFRCDTLKSENCRHLSEMRGEHMGLYELLGIQDNWTDAEIATYLSMQREAWNRKRISTRESERREADFRVKQIDVLEGAEARLGNFIRPALVMKTLCAAMDNRYSDYYGLEEGLVRSCNLGNFRSEFRSVMAYLDQIGETELIREWKETLAQLGVEVPMPRKRNAGENSQRSGAQEREADRREPGRNHPGRTASGRKEAGRRQQKQRRTENGTRTRGTQSSVSEKVLAVLGAIGISLRRFFRKLKKKLQRIRWSELPKKVWAAIAGVVLVLILLIVLISRVSATRKAAAEQKAQEEAAAAASLAAEEQAKKEQEALIASLKGLDDFQLTTDEAAAASYQTVKPASCNASSMLVGTTGKSYGTEYLFDGDLETSWQEGEEGDGIGVTLTSAFAARTEVKGIAFWNGNEISQDRFAANNRLKDITVSISCKGQSYTTAYTLQDVMGEQVILFDEPVPMESVVIRIDSVYNGSVYQDTVLSELAFLTVKE